ncbi:major facilitator superfamily domain-containing protein 6-like [Aegotheles albertisi]
MSQQWDIGRALALSGLFRLLQGAGRACAAPFLTLYLRHLGLPAPLVGLVAGARYLAAALWAPLCARCPRGRGRRRGLVAGSLLGSAGAGLLLTLIPPAGGAAGGPLCSASQQPGHRAGTATRPGPSVSSYSASAVSTGTGGRAGSEGAARTTGATLTASREPALSTPAFQGPFGLTEVLEKEGRGGGGDTETTGHPSAGTTAVTAGNWETREPRVLASYSPPGPGPGRGTSSLGSAAAAPADSAEEHLHATERNELPSFTTTLPAVGVAYVSRNLPDHQKDTQDAGFKAVQSIFQDREYQVFLMALGAVVLWELLATSFEQTVDEGLYEYLDFVDATDRYGKLWIWSYLGASVGACSIAILVDHLDCSLRSTVARLALHFYGYALLVTLSLFVSVFFPIHVPKKPDRGDRTSKALSLLWSDGRATLCAITAVLAGAAGSAVHNFLFWQMQDRGSSELYMGLSVAVALLAEILLSFFKGKLLRTFSSSKIVAASLSLLAVQLLCFSFPWAATKSAAVIPVLQRETLK